MPCLPKCPEKPHACRRPQETGRTRGAPGWWARGGPTSCGGRPAELRRRCSMEGGGRARPQGGQLVFPVSVWPPGRGQQHGGRGAGLRGRQAHSRIFIMHSEKTEAADTGALQPPDSGSDRRGCLDAGGMQERPGGLSLGDVGKFTLTKEVSPGAGRHMLSPAPTEAPRGARGQVGENTGGQVGRRAAEWTCGWGVGDVGGWVNR